MLKNTLKVSFTEFVDWPLARWDLIWTKAKEKLISPSFCLPPVPSSHCLQRCRSVRSMRSGGSCWSWLWWDSSSFWSWSSLYCCMDKAPSTRPVAQVCGHTYSDIQLSGNVLHFRCIFSLLSLNGVPLTVSRRTTCTLRWLITMYSTFYASEKLRHASLHVHCLSSKVACSSLVPTRLPLPLRPYDRGKLGQPCSFTRMNQDSWTAPESISAKMIPL